MNSVSPTVSALGAIELAAKAYAAARARIAERVGDLTAEVQAIHRRRMPGIKSALAEAKDLQAQLVAAVQEHPELFQRPRTLTLHGIKVGFAKGAGRVDWDCEDDVLVARIEKQFADDPAALELLIATKRVPVKSALKDLEAKILARLGVEVEATGDYVVVKASDTEVDKVVAKILKEGAVEEADAAAS